MLKILQGDDTAANNRTITLRLPSDDIGEGFEIGFLFLGIDKSGPYAPGGTLKFDCTREQTSCFPLGIHYAKTYLKKDNLIQTISNSIQVKVTDSADELNDNSSPSGGGNGNGGEDGGDGDVNRDGVVNASDALLVLKAAVGKAVLTDSETVAGDMNRDGRLDATDALAILKKAVGK